MQGGEIFNKFQLKHQEIRWPAELVQGMPNDSCEAVPRRQRLRRETYGGVQICMRCGLSNTSEAFNIGLRNFDGVHTWYETCHKKTCMIKIQTEAMLRVQARLHGCITCLFSSTPPHGMRVPNRRQEAWDKQLVLSSMTPW